MKPAILHFDDTTMFWNRMDRNYRRKYEAIVSQPNFTAYDMRYPRQEILAGKYDLLLVGTFGHCGNKCLPEKAVEPEKLDHIPRKCVILEDMRRDTFMGGVDAFCTQLDQYYDYVIATYDCRELEYIRSRCPNIRRFFILPHYIDTSIFRDYGLEKTWDVLFYGNVRVEHYPFRSRLLHILKNSGFSLKIIEHPGYKDYIAEVCGERLARMINQARITIATPTTSDYLVAKYYEISGAGSMVAGKMATEGEEKWQGHYLRLEEKMSDEEIINQIKLTLEDEERLVTSTGYMNRLIRNQCGLDRFLPALDCIIMEMMGDLSSTTMELAETM